MRDAVGSFFKLANRTRSRAGNCGYGKSEGPDRKMIWGGRNRSAHAANRREFGEETVMLRFVVALGLCCMAVATPASSQSR